MPPDPPTGVPVEVPPNGLPHAVASVAAVAGAGTVAAPRWSPDGSRLAWVRSGGGAAEVVVDGTAVPGAEPAGTRGVPFVWGGPGLLLLPTEAGLVAVAVGGDAAPVPSSVPWAVRGQLSAPFVAHGAGLVAFVDEHDTGWPVVVGALDGGSPPRVVSRADFARDPVLSPDGTLVAWHEWDAPDMPWDGSRIVVARADGTDPVVVAGGPAESVGQPRFAPGGGPARLALVSDRDGWANLTVVAADGSRARAVLPEPFEHAEPSWGPGQRSYAWSPDGTRLAWCRNEDGFGRLVVGDAPVAGPAPAAGPSPGRAWGKGWHHGLDWGHRGLVAVRSGARTPPSVVVYEGDPPTRRVVDVAPGVADLDTEHLVEPRPVSWVADDGAEVPALLFSPPGVARPPLLVHLHGGPTDETRVEWSPRLQHFVARGWAVLAPNPRGSTGSGRAHAQALRGGWGALDVDDVVAGLRAASAASWGDPARVALVGGSAGGFTALHVAVRAPARVRAVVVSYPVTDLHALAATTHRFERHYNDGLVGALPAAASRWRDRSPRTHAAALRAPVLVLHGDADPVVSLAQSQAFVEAVRDAGGDARLHVYAGEGHGWSRPETVADALARTGDFLTREVIAP